MELREGYKRTEIGIIPEDWGVKSLGDIGSFKNGINKSKEDFGFGYPFVNLMDVFGKPKICGDEEFGLINSNDAERNLYNLKYNDLLFIRSSVKPSGVGLTSVISKDLKETVFSGFLIRFRDNGKLDVEYKKHCFYEERFRIQLISNSSVSANTNINQDALKILNIPLPPLPEQKAIAEVLSDTDELIQTMEKKIAKKRLIKQGAMQKLLTPPSQPEALEGWEVKKLGEVAEIRNGYAFKSITYDNNGKYRIITIANVQDGFMDITNCNKITNLPKDIQSHQRLFKGDLLMSMTGNVGRTCIVSENNSLLNQRVGKLIVTDIKMKFFFYLVQDRKFLNQMILNAQGGAQGNIGKNDILGYETYIPLNKSEQTQIATILSDMDNEIEMLENKLTKYKKLKQGMMQELLTGRTRLV